MPNRKPRHEDREPVSLEWQPVGNVGRARLVAVGVDTGAICDIDTLDLSRADDRRGYAVRAVERFGRWTVAQVEAELLKLAVERCGIAPEPEAAMLTLTDALDEWQCHEAVPAVCTGFWALDSLAGGELPGGLPLGTITVLLGPPAAGKSALGLQCVVGALLADPDLRALWALGEMSQAALAARAIAVGSVLIGDGEPVTKAQAERRKPAAKAVADELRQRIAERLVMVPPILTPDRIEQAVVASGAKLAVVDYLQLVRLPDAADSRTEVDGVMARLRAMSLEHNCAILLISNISKGIDGNSRIGSLGKNSSQIDFDADLVLLGQAGDELNEDGVLPVKWLCKKHRHGQPRDLNTLFDGDRQTFTDAEAVEPYEEFSGFTGKAAAR
jgi:replicative DNA helicase